MKARVDTHEWCHCNVHGIESRILSSQVHCLSALASQWHQQVLRLGSGCPHKWGTPEQRHGWTHTVPGWVTGRENKMFRRVFLYDCCFLIDVHVFTCMRLSNIPLPVILSYVATKCHASESQTSDCFMHYFCHSLLLGIGPSSCAASSSWW